MKRLLIITLLCLPCTAWGDHLDVITFQMKEGCPLDTYLQIVADFNTDWAAEYGYRAEVAVPLQGGAMGTINWVGRSADAAVWGAAWEAWAKQIQDPESVAGKLHVRFSECVHPWESRRSYTLY